MRYFLNIYQTPLAFVLAFVSLFLFLLIFLSITFTSIKFLKHKEIWTWVLTIISVFGAGILCAFTIVELPTYMLDGQITDLYFLDDGQEARVIVWFTNEQDGNMIQLYTNRLKGFDLESGNKLDRLELNRRYYINDYKIYGPFGGNLAWGYSEQVGTSLINLFDLNIVLNQSKIQEQNSELGSSFEPLENNFYNSEKHSLTFYNYKGQNINVIPTYNENSVKELETWDASYLENKLNIQDIFKSEKAYIISVLNKNNETYVFVSIDGYTLSALKIDLNTNEILGQIDYFK